MGIPPVYMRSKALLHSVNTHLKFNLRTTNNKPQAEPNWVLPKEIQPLIAIILVLPLFCNNLSDLHRIPRSTFEKVIRDDPQVQTTLITKVTT
ncbi:hypothetical protein D3C81_1236650 [compost metagenome]